MRACATRAGGSSSGCLSPLKSGGGYRDASGRAPRFNLHPSISTPQSAARRSRRRTHQMSGKGRGDRDSSTGLEGRPGMKNRSHSRKLATRWRRTRSRGSSDAYRDQGVGRRRHRGGAATQRWRENSAASSMIRSAYSGARTGLKKGESGRAYSDVLERTGDPDGLRIPSEHDR